MMVKLLSWWVFLSISAVLAGCVTTQTQPDGKTKVSVSLPDALKAPAQPAHPAVTGPAITQATISKPDTITPPTNLIKGTALAGLFAKHPFDGTSKTYYPRAAVKVTDWSRSDCWTATATIWRSASKSESVAPFAVCWGTSMGFAINNAASLQLFMTQSSVEHTGNVRTNGPKPPMLAVPERTTFGESKQLAFQGFVEQLALDTGWQPGAPTNLWIVGYGK